MKREKLLLVAGFTLAVGLIFSWNVLSASKKEYNLKQEMQRMNLEIQCMDLEMQRARAYGEIQNVFAAHWYCYEAQKQEYAVENFWSKRDDISYGAGNFGRDAVINYFVDTNKRAREAKLQRMSELFPEEVKNVPENEGIGDMVIHLLTTPHIEVAGDCKTAIGLWYVPSLNVEIGVDGEPVPVTIWSKDRVAFIKEDGHWKIWHFDGYVQFADSLDPSFLGPWKPDRPFFETKPLPLEERMYPSQPTAQPRGNYSTKRVADWSPHLPQPYDTWDDIGDFYQSNKIIESGISSIW